MRASETMRDQVRSSEIPLPPTYPALAGLFGINVDSQQIVEAWIAARHKRQERKIVAEVATGLILPH